MSRRPTQGSVGASAGVFVAEGDQLVGGWLEALARAGNGLLKACGRRRLRALFRHYLAHPDLRLSPNGQISSVPPADLEAAAQSLRAQAAATAFSNQVRAAAAAFSKTLEGAARPAGAAKAPRALPRPAEALWQASLAIENARTPGAVACAATEGARQLCQAQSAVWWERQDGSLLALAAAGAQVPEERRSFRPPVGFWTSRAARDGRLVELSAKVPEHAGLLTRFGAQRGVIIRARAGGRWRGVLSVHDGDFSTDRIGLLLALVEQGAAAMQALGPARSLQHLIESVAEEGPAMAAAVSLADLLDRVCGLVAEVVDGACFLFLADEAGRLSLRCHAGAAPDEAPEAAAALASLAAQVRLWDAAEVIASDAPALAEAPLQSLRTRGFRTALGVPLVVHEHRLGAVIALSRRAAMGDAQEQERVQGLAARAAAEIESMQLLESAQRRLTEISDLTRVGRHVVNTLDLDSIAQTVVESVAEVLNVPRAAIFIASRSGELEPVEKGQIGFVEAKRSPLPASGHVGAEALVAHAPLAVTDAAVEGRAGDPLVLWMEARSLACAPLTTPQGLRGLLVVADSTPRSFELHAMSLLSSHANQAALALQGAVLYRQAVEQLRRLAKLGEMSEALTTSQSPTQSAGALLESAIALFDAQVGMVWLVEPATGDLVLAAIHGLRSDEWAMERVRSGEGLPGLAAQSGRPLISADITRDGRFPYRQQAREMGLGPAIAAPLIAHGDTMGVVGLFRRAPNTFTEEDRGLLVSMSNNAAIALQNAYLHEEARRRAEFVAAMMSEVNHRMRNSLQSVAGLLRMELERPPRRSVEDTVRRAISHIQAVAAVHEAVREPEVYLVDIKEVALRVAKLPRGVRDQHIDVQVSGTRVMLPSQRAISIALMLNELVDNAVQHGLAGTEGGRISISLTEAGREVVVQVRNTGVGPPKDFDVEASPGLGLKIVRGLVEQELGGRLELETKNGFVARARFPKLD